MENRPQPSGNSPPPKPWERAGSSSVPAPFKPPSSGSTSDVVEASGTARPGEIVSTADANTTVHRNALGITYLLGPGSSRHITATHMEMQGVVTFFGRIVILIDQNTRAFHMFISALLQLFDQSGLFYGELARFVLRLLGIRTKPQKVQPPGFNSLPGPHNPQGGQNYVEGPMAAPAGAWDGVWGNDASN